MTHEGELFACEMYVVESGSFQFSTSQVAGSEHDKMDQFNTMGEAKPGGCFGELAMLHHSPRSCNVVATTDGVLWCIDRSEFHGVLTEGLQKEKEAR